MADTTKIALWIDQDVDKLARKFKKNFEDHNWRLGKAKTLDEGLELLNFDESLVDLIIVDVSSESKDPKARYGVLQDIRQMDPDIPIFVITHQPDAELHLAAGKANAEVANKDELLSNPNKSIKVLFDRMEESVRPTPSYDLEQRILANKVARGYEKLETERPGTVAYWLFEEELIRGIVREKEKRQAKSLNVLDLGSGTGRYARVILDVSSTAQVTCVDFSGQMLLEASKKLDPYVQGGRCKFIRALAERLPGEYVEYFDLVILGFGFPSYTPTTPILRGVSRVIKTDGLLFASVYNHRALAYDRWAGVANQDDPQRPISTWIDREMGEIWIRTGSATPEKLKARTYTTSQFARELRQAGFKVGGYLSFPVLYSVLSCSQIAERAESERRDECYGNTQFSFSLWDLDRELIRSLKDRGFYSVLLASESDQPLQDIAPHLDMHPVDTLKP
jgi:ubiquinone/menaquinone biosynthesis C-methylase UbiE